MAFLDNSGDIILDAVLTDEGRRRLARADGGFKIVKFALGDDEVDYANYDRNHSSGSAYYDLEILQTPVLEAFTNNDSLLKSKLLTYLDNTKFYLPVTAINDLVDATARMSSANNVNVFGVAVTKTSRDSFSTVVGVMDGFAPSAGSTHIHTSQGLNTTVITPDVVINPEDRETQYIVQMDNRLGTVVSNAGSAASVSFIDDDDIATYYVTLAANPAIVSVNINTELSSLTEIIKGPRGTDLKFKIKSSLHLRRSNYLFDQIGSTTTLNDSAGSSTAIRYIDSTIKVTGATTGYTLYIPVRYIKTSAE